MRTAITTLVLALGLAITAPALAADAKSDAAAAKKKADTGATEAEADAKTDGKKAAAAAKKAGEDVQEAAAPAVEAVQQAGTPTPANLKAACDELAAAEAAEAAAAAAAAEAAKPPVKPKVKVSLVAEAGSSLLLGNTNSFNANGGIKFGLTQQRHSFGLTFGGNYGQSRTDATQADLKDWTMTAARIFGDARYDLGLVPSTKTPGAYRNSLYVGAGAFHDRIAGYDVRIRGDVGYAHKIVNLDAHKLVAEAGFNYTFEDYYVWSDVKANRVAKPDPAIGHFIGGRAFVGYALNIKDSFGVQTSFEALLGGTDHGGSLIQSSGLDGRLTYDLGISGSLSKVISIKAGYKMIHDIQPPEGAKDTDHTVGIAVVATLL
jgi:putative salt-induced outer membrane protein YdiY